MTNSKAWSRKPQLGAIAFEGITYRQMRDALVRLPNTFHSNDLGLLLSLEEVSKAYNRDEGYGASQRLTPTEAMRTANWIFRDNEAAKMKETASAVRNACDLGSRVSAWLGQEGFIEPDTRENRWMTATRGAVLKAQKALKPISRSRGVEYVRKAVQVAKDFNAESGPNYFVTRLCLFGSLLSNNSEVGDVDLLIRTEPRIPIAPYEGHERRERARLAVIAPSRIHSLMPTTEYEGPNRIKKISQYISIGSLGVLESQLEEDGEPFRLVYGHVGGWTRNPGTEVTDHEVQEAKSFLLSLR